MKVMNTPRWLRKLLRRLLHCPPRVEARMEFLEVRFYEMDFESFSPPFFFGVSPMSNPITLKFGKTAQATLDVKVDGVSIPPDPGTSWSSNTTGVAQIDQNGLVTAGNAVGNSLITATGTVTPAGGSPLPFTSTGTVDVEAANVVTATMDFTAI